MKGLDMKVLIVCFACLWVFGTTQPVEVDGSLNGSFYGDSCPDVEAIIRSIVWDHVARNPALPAKLLRMHFHDCFVLGCDGSVLLNTTDECNKAEKDAGPNLSLAGFDVIDEVKAVLEEACPSVVSCADILALAARDAVSYQFKVPLWEVPTGRRDGTVSLESEALSNLPSPFSNFTTLVENFASKGLSIEDLVILSGGHTIGIGHCGAISTRLYNFTGNGDKDPSLNPIYADILRTKCTPKDTTTAVDMDPGSSLSFDNHYFKILTQHEGLFTSDAALLTDEGSLKVVNEMLHPQKFYVKFGESMRKMGMVGVITGKNGQIRDVCSKINTDQNECSDQDGFNNICRA